MAGQLIDPYGFIEDILCTRCWAMGLGRFMFPFYPSKTFSTLTKEPT
jgi:hypothetical protein